MAVKKKNKRVIKAKKGPKFVREHRSLDNEYPLPKKWWIDVPRLSGEAEEDLLCDISRLVKGLLGTPIKRVQSIYYAEDLYYLLAENKRLRIENKKLKRKLTE